MPETPVAWFDFVFKVFAMTATIWWIVWHRREGRRMVREEDRLFAPAGDVAALERKVETLVPKETHAKLEAAFNAHQQWIMAEIEKVYTRMKTDTDNTAAQIRESGQAVAQTLQNMSEKIGVIVGKLEGMTKRV